MADNPLILLDQRSGSSRMWQLRVKIPLIPAREGMSWVWVLISEFGADEDAAMENTLGRFPEAVQVLPASYKADLDLASLTHLPPVKQEVVCQSMCKDDVGREHAWCRYCGQGATEHPVLSGTHAGKDAENWISSCRSEMQGWDGNMGYGMLD